MKSHKKTKRAGSDPLRVTYAVVIRFYRIHQALFEQQQRDNGVRPWITSASLASELEISVRTLQQDIARLRDDWGMPIYYVEKRKGIGYTEPVTSLPSQIYSRSESMALCFAMLASALYQDTPFAATTRAVVKKLTAGLRKELAVDFQALERSVSFHCTGADAFILPVNFEVIIPAILHRQQIEIDYVKAFDPAPLDSRRDAESGLRRVEPLHLACIDFGWYLFAYDPARQDIRTFALRRIRDLRMTGSTVPPRVFDIKRELANSFGPFRSDKADTVRLRFWGRAATVIPEFRWHPSQKIAPAPDQPGAIDVHLQVAVNPRLIGWIKEWLGEVAVLEPQSLRQTVIEATRRGLEALERIGGIEPAIA